MTRVAQAARPRLPWLPLLALFPLACSEAEPPTVPDIAYCDPVREWDPQLVEFERQVLVLVNEQRAAGATCGDDEFEPAPEFTMDPALRCAARMHALDMGAQDYFSNLDPEDLRFDDRAQMAGYEGTALGQTIGAAHREPEQLITALMGSAGPCAELMNPAATQLGMGYALASEAEYANYWTQVYGVRE